MKVITLETTNRVMSSRKNKKSYTGIDFYEAYLDYVKDDPRAYISYTIFRSIINDYFKFIRDEILEYSKEFKLPGKLGYIYIRKRKIIEYSPNHMMVDFKATKDYGKTIYHMNEHSDGYNYRFVWKKRSVFVRNSTMYEMVFTRTNKRRLAKIIKTKAKDYIEE